MKITLKGMLDLISGGDVVSIQDGEGKVRFNGMVKDFWRLPETDDKNALLLSEVAQIRSDRFCTVILLK